MANVGEFLHDMGPLKCISVLEFFLKLSTHRISKILNKVKSVQSQNSQRASPFDPVAYLAKLSFIINLNVSSEVRNE